MLTSVSEVQHFFYLYIILQQLEWININTNVGKKPTNCIFLDCAIMLRLNNCRMQLHIESLFYVYYVIVVVLIIGTWCNTFDCSTMMQY